MAQQGRRKIEGITEGNLNLAIAKLAGPMMAASFLQDLLAMVDLYFVGTLGYIAVAAVAIAGSLVGILIMVVAGIGIGTTALVAQFVGEKRAEKADKVVGQTVLLAAAGSLLMIVVTIFALRPLLVLCGATDEMLDLSVQYANVVFGCSFLMFFFMGINSALQGAGDTVTPLKLMVVVNILNIVLAPVFINGFGPIPAMGVVGSAWASTVSRAVGLIILLFHVIRPGGVVRLRLEALRPDFVLIREICSIGVYASLQFFIRQISFLIIMRIVAGFGPILVAAYGIGNRLRMLVMGPGHAFAGVAAILAGQNLGARQPERARMGVWRSVLIYECLVVPVAIAFFIFAPWLIARFTTEPDVIAAGALYLRFLTVTFPIFAFEFVLTEAMNGAGYTSTPTIAHAIGHLIVRVPVAWALAVAVGMGPVGVWLAINACDIALAILMIWLFNRGGWLRAFDKRVARQEAAAAKEVVAAEEIVASQ